MVMANPQIDARQFLGILGQYGATPTPDYQTFTAPLSNKGNPTSRIDKGGNTFAVTSSAPIRLVDNRTKQVIYEGTGYDAAQEAIKLAQDLSNTYGKKASWEIQSASPGSEGWTTLAKEKKNKSILGAIADIALPIAGSFIPGVGPVLGAAIGSGASSVAQGRSLENTLLRAGLAAGGSALGGGILGKGVPPGATDAAISANVNNAINAAYQAAQQGAASSLGSVYGGALGGIGAGAGSALSSAASSVAGGFPEEIFVTATRAGAPISTGAALGAGAGSLIPEGVSLADRGLSSLEENLRAANEAAQRDLASVGAGTGGGFLSGLTKNMGLLDYLTLGSLAGSALGSLAGGGKGSGGGAGTPYVSPFGAGPVFGAGTDMRATPAIEDYERYGFGPEATFFRPEYNRLVSGAVGTRPLANMPLATNSVTQPSSSGSNLASAVGSALLGSSLPLFNYSSASLLNKYTPDDYKAAYDNLTQSQPTYTPLLNG